MQRQQSKLNKWKHILKVLVTQSCPTLCDPMDCSLAGSSVYGNSPDNNTGVDSIFYSRGSSRGDWTWVSCIAGRSFTIWATGKAHNTEVGCISFSRGSSWSRGQTHISWVSCNEGKFFTSEKPRKPSHRWVNKSQAWYAKFLQDKFFIGLYSSGGMACCSLWGCAESNMTWWLNNNTSKKECNFNYFTVRTK